MKFWMLPGVLVITLGALAFNAWLFMLCMGAAHSVWVGVPALGYWASLGILCLVALVARLLGLGR